MVKILRPALLGDEHERRAFRREIDVAGRLDHDGVVRLRGWADGDDLAYSLWEHVASPSLVFGLAATLYEATTGLTAFETGDPDAAGAARYPQLEADAQPLGELVPACPARVAAVLDEGLAREARGRPDARTVAEVLGAAARELGVPL